MFHITDWTGRDCFEGRTFNTAEEASSHLIDSLEKAHPNATEEEFNTFMDEFYIEPVKD